MWQPLTPPKYPRVRPVHTVPEPVAGYQTILTNGTAPMLGAPPLTESDVRRIVREELDRPKDDPSVSFTAKDDQADYEAYDGCSIGGDFFLPIKKPAPPGEGEG